MSAAQASADILGVRIHASSYKAVIDQIVTWSDNRESRSVLFANAHMLMEAFDDPALRENLNSADLVNSDGMPLVWALKMLRLPATRVYGPDCTIRALAECARLGIPVGFYGGSPATLKTLLQRVTESHSGLHVAYHCSPPFRLLNDSEAQGVIRQITDSGVRVLFVGLGCPKQERWISSFRNRIPVVMLGVGAAFEFLAGTKPQAPRWMMEIGFEWLFRLATEPLRLWRRYLYNNPRFAVICALQIISKRLHIKGGRNDGS